MRTLTVFVVIAALVVAWCCYSSEVPGPNGQAAAADAVGSGHSAERVVAVRSEPSRFPDLKREDVGGARVFVVDQSGEKCGGAVIATNRDSVVLDADAIVAEADDDGVCYIPADALPDSDLVVSMSGFVPRVIGKLGVGTTRVVLEEGEGAVIEARDINGRPVPNVEVTLAPVLSYSIVKSARPAMYHGLTGFARATTNERGVARMQGLVPGSYYVRINHDTMVREFDRDADFRPVSVPGRFTVTLSEPMVACWRYPEAAPLETWSRLRSRGGKVGDLPDRVSSLRKKFPDMHVIAVSGINSQMAPLSVDALFPARGVVSSSVEFRPLGRVHKPHDVLLGVPEPGKSGAVRVSVSGLWFDRQFLDLYASAGGSEFASLGDSGQKRRISIPAFEDLRLPIGKYVIRSSRGLVREREFEVVAGSTSNLELPCLRNFSMLDLAVVDKRGRSLSGATAMFVRDGRHQGCSLNSKALIPFEVGEHRIRVVANGFRDGDITFVVRPGMRGTVSAEQVTLRYKGDA